jgi:hypothetical protein
MLYPSYAIFSRFSEKSKRTMRPPHISVTFEEFRFRAALAATQWISLLKKVDNFNRTVTAAGRHLETAHRWQGEALRTPLQSAPNPNRHVLPGGFGRGA